jgi:hypothetical protein
MSTIASLAIRLGMDNQGFLDGARKTVQMAEKIATSMVRNNAVVKAAGAAWRAADQAAHGYAKTIIGGAAAAGIAAGAVAKLKSALSASATGQFAESIKGIKSALEGASNAFGTSFARWSNLREAAQKIENILINLKPAFAAAGAALGMFIRPFVAMLPVIAATAVALKGLAFVIGVALHVAITQGIVRPGTWLVLGKSMGSLSLAWAAGVKLLAAAQWIYNGALAATAKLGIPLWGAMVAGASALAAAVGLVVAVGTAMYFAWQRLSAGDPIAKQASQAQRLSEEFEEATSGARKLIDALADEAASVGLTDAQKKTKELARELEKLHNSGIVVDHTAMEAQLQANLRMLEVAKSRAAAKMMAAMKAAGATDRERQIALSLQNEIERRESIVALEREMAAIAKDVEMSGLSAIEQRLRGARELGATEAEIAGLRARMEGVETARQAAQNRLDIEKRIAELTQEAAFAGLSAAERELALAEQRGATEEQIARMKGAMDAATLAAKAQSVIQATKNDAERMAEKVGELKTLLARGLISQEVYGRAMQQAEEMANRAQPRRGEMKLMQDRGHDVGIGAITKGSQADIAARVRQKGDANKKGVEENTAKANVLLERIAGNMNKGEPVQVYSF